MVVKVDKSLYILRLVLEWLIIDLSAAGKKPS